MKLLILIDVSVTEMACVKVLGGKLEEVENRKRILIVDDDQDILDVLVMLMEMEGFSAIGILDASKFYKTLSGFNPDLVMLDIMLGHVDGRDLCRMVKSNVLTEKLPVIMVSAGHRETTANQHYHPDGFIQKPFDIQLVVNTINKNLITSEYDSLLPNFKN
ncbi:DNA-binding response OmpR family regulator [Pedobacter sp. UYP30]|uniref:response regulator n=1 Tax=Pedobacter sp. UYP30 TaxID=1756400 RepID=UPI003398D24A